MTAISLSRIMPPPAKPLEADGSWFHAEESLETSLPDDFKDFIRSVGSGGNWTIVVNESRGPDCEQFECNLTTLLEDLLDKSLICGVFPDNVFDGAEFTPYS